MVFRVADFGEVFSTRPRGRDLRVTLEQRLRAGDDVIVSFASVAKVSQSFSDEFLGALLADLGVDRVRIDGEMSPSVERVLARAVRRRGFVGVEDLRAVTA